MEENQVKELFLNVTSYIEKIDPEHKLNFIFIVGDEKGAANLISQDANSAFSLLYTVLSPINSSYLPPEISRGMQDIRAAMLQSNIKEFMHFPGNFTKNSH